MQENIFTLSTENSTFEKCSPISGPTLDQCRVFHILIPSRSNSRPRFAITKPLFNVGPTLFHVPHPQITNRRASLVGPHELDCPFLIHSLFLGEHLAFSSLCLRLGVSFNLQILLMLFIDQFGFLISSFDMF